MKKIALLVTSAFALSIAAPAAAQNFVTGDATVTGLGADQAAYPGTPFDTLALTSRVENYTGDGLYNFNNVSFTTGTNRNDNSSFSGTLNLTGLYMGTQAFTYAVKYAGTIGSTDSITVGGNTVTILGQKVKFNALTLTGSQPNDTITGVLTATVGAGAVPEPATWALMIVGFGATGGALRRRAKVRTNVSFA